MRLATTALLTMILLAACGPDASSAKQTAGAADPAAMPPDSAFAPPPAVSDATPPVQPISNTAAAITGAATFAPAAYTFALGQSYAVKREAVMASDVRWSADGGTWADLLGVDSGGQIELVRVTAQSVDAGKARNGGLCGAGPVRWIATSRTAEDVGAEVVMAAFSGVRPPGPTGRDEDLCGTFNYAAGN